MNEKERICLMNKFRERFLTVEFLDEQENLIDFVVLDKYTKQTKTIMNNKKAPENFIKFVKETKIYLEETLETGDETTKTTILGETIRLLKDFNKVSGKTLMDYISLTSLYYFDDNNKPRSIFGDLFYSPHVKPALPALKSTRPQKAVISNTKLANVITKDFIGAGQIELTVGGTKKKPISVFAALDYDDENLTITGRQPFTAYDRAVHNGVCTVYEAGNKAFTPEMVYRAMNGLSDTERISTQAIGAVTKSIEKSRLTKLTIDFTQEAKARGLNTKKTSIDDMLLSAQKITVAIPGGKEPKEAYQFNTKPILYKYSQEVKQVLTIPIKLLRTRETQNTTAELIVLREYLLRRIEGMRGTNQLTSNKILYGSIYKGLDLQEPAKQKTAKIRAHSKNLLKYWKKEKYIKDYMEYKDRRKIKGIEINL